MTTDARVRPSLERLLRPRSVAIIGISKEPGSLGETQVGNFDRFGFTGALHLVSRNRDAVDGHACVRSVEELPHGIDAAVVCVPRAGVVETLEALAQRGVGGAMVFASGFAEQDEAGRLDQERIVAIAAEYGMAINGPNCLGLTNWVDRIPYAFNASEPRDVPAGRTAAAVVTQSGATMANVARALVARGVAVSYQMSTGNEAVIGIEDYLAFVLDGGGSGPIAMFAEQIRRPRAFLALARRARADGRHIVLLHPGSSEGARAAALSHTGAVAGDYAAMRTAVTAAGVLIVDDLDMLIDCTTILARYPEPPRGGVAVTSDSGAVKSLVLDQCAELGLELTAFGPAAIAEIREALPSFAVASNPLDLTAQCIYDRFLYERTAHAMIGDPGVGSFLGVIQPGPNLRWLRENALFDEMRATAKPAIVALPNSDATWPDDLIAQMIEREIVFTQTGTQALRALAALHVYGEGRARFSATPSAISAPVLPHDARGALTETASKSILRNTGVSVPDGALANNVEAACAVAARIGYPVALKVQAAWLTHKSDAGAVAIGVANDDELAVAWERITGNVTRAFPERSVDGCLVEAMGARGLELIVGARRDPDWGPVLLAGLGGVWIEALGDVALFAGGASRDEIRAGLLHLKGARLLTGMRGSAAIDLDAVIDTLQRLDALLSANPSMMDVEINPLVAYPDGATALDALIIMA